MEQCKHRAEDRDGDFSTDMSGPSRSLDTSSQAAYSTHALRSPEDPAAPHKPTGVGVIEQDSPILPWGVSLPGQGLLYSIPTVSLLSRSVLALAGAQ